MEASSATRPTNTEFLNLVYMNKIVSGVEAYKSQVKLPHSMSAAAGDRARGSWEAAARRHLAEVLLTTGATSGRTLVAWALRAQHRVEAWVWEEAGSQSNNTLST